MSKFQKGQLVEVIRSSNATLMGHRFIVTDTSIGTWVNEDLTGLLGYKSDLPAPNNIHGFLYCPEPWLKLVAPDSDELSEFSFSELLSELKVNNLIKE